MSAFGFDLSDLHDARLAPLATSQLPAWLWRADATRIIWANAVGAAILGASTSAAVAAREFDAAHPAAAQITRLATTLPTEAPPRLERLHGFGGDLDRTLTCTCSHLILRDGTPAVLVVAAEPAGPELTLSERVHRLFAGSHEPVAAFSAAGQLLCATPSAHAHLRSASSLAALGAQALAANALASGHATGSVGNERVSIDRLGDDTAAVLVVNFAANGQIPTSCEPLAPESRPPEPATAASEQALMSAQTTAGGTPSFASPPGQSPTSPKWPAPDERHLPLRFVWHLDEHGRFTLDSDEFIELVGARTAAMAGRPWADLAAELALDPDGQIARAIATHDTWSGLSVSWPVDGGKDRLPVELSGLPIFDRERIFRGYRGFGVCRDMARLTALMITRRARASLSDQPADQMAASAAPERPLAAMNTPGENIFPFPAGAAEVTAPALTPLEHMAFRELSRKLAQGLAGARAEPDMGTAGPPMGEDRMAAAEARPIENASDARPVLERIPVGILVYRLTHLLYANSTFLRWSGHRSLEGLIEAGGLDELFIEPLAAAAAGDDGSVTLRMERGDKVALKGEVINIDWQGEPAHALVTALKQGDPGKLEPLQAEVAELRSILDASNAQWKETERSLIEARQQAEAASSAKSDFLAKISHEIRTPLNSIIGFSEVMLAEQFGPLGNERYREYLKDIYASGGHLLSLINDLLDLSKIEAGKLQLTFAGLALNDLTAQCVATMQPPANRGRIIIRTALAPALPQVLADARSVRQIVLNLLSNSLKFTPAGGQVIVSTALNRDGDVILRVRDTGVGMTEKDIETALEPFRQLATSPRGGTGLGLPLTKAMAEANRARFHLTSTPQEGTLVEIAFPATRTLAR